MTWRTYLLLSAGSPVDDRDRRLLLAGAVAVAGALLIATGSLLQLNGEVDVNLGYAHYVSEQGLRGGVVIGALLLTVPLLALAYQAVQVGSAARRRRTEQLVLAGATPQQAQAISALQAVRAATAGALLAGPAYLALSAALGPLSAFGERLLPSPGPLDLVWWMFVVVLAVIGTGLADMLAGRQRWHRPRRVRVVVAGAAVVLTIALVVLGAHEHGSPAVEGAALAGAASLLLVAALSLGPPLVLAAVWWQQRRPSAVDLLASSRTLTDLRGPGRVAAVLLMAGLVIGFESGLSFAQSGDPTFYRQGAVMTSVAVGFAVLVALLTLVVGAAEQLLDSTRTLASMHALGVDAVTLRRVQQRQLASATVPATALGLLVGSLISRYAFQIGLAPAVLSLAVAAVGAAAVELLCLGATWSLSRRREAATDIEHLRAT